MTRLMPILLTSFCEIWDRYLYYSIQASLVIILTSHFNFSHANAYEIYGVFTTLTFSIAIIGGFIADKLSGSVVTIILGAFFMIAANIILCFHQLHYYLSGLSLSIIGSGLVKPNCANLIAIICEKKKLNKDKAFTVLYIAMNIGALTGPFIFGLLYSHHLAYVSYLSGAVGTLITISLLYYILNKEYQSVVPKKHWLGIIIAILLIIPIMTSFFYEMIQYLLIFLIFCVAAGSITHIYIKSHLARIEIIKISILLIFMVVFFACSFQTATTIMLFIQEFANRHFVGINFSAISYLAIQPFLIIIFSPLITKIWLWLEHQYKLDASIKIITGLSFTAIAFLTFSFLSQSQLLNEDNISSLFICLGNLSISIGEICILPIILTEVGKIIHIQYKSFMMSLVFVFIGFSGFFAGLLAKCLDHTNSLHSFTSIFNKLSFIALIAALLLLIIRLLFKKIFLCSV